MQSIHFSIYITHDVLIIERLIDVIDVGMQQNIYLKKKKN